MFQTNGTNYKFWDRVIYIYYIYVFHMMLILSFGKICVCMLKPKTESSKALCYRAVFSSSLFGFRSGARTENALFKFTDDILQCFDIIIKLKLQPSWISVRQAFHCVNHDILLTTLRKYGVNFNAFQWIKSTLRQGTRCLLESWDSFTYIKFKYRCFLRVNFPVLSCRLCSLLMTQQYMFVMSLLMM